MEICIKIRITFTNNSNCKSRAQSSVKEIHQRDCSLQWKLRQKCRIQFYTNCEHIKSKCCIIAEKRLFCIVPIKCNANNSIETQQKKKINGNIQLFIGTQAICSGN